MQAMDKTGLGEQRHNRRWPVLLVATLALVACAASCAWRRDGADGKTVLRVWHVWGGTMAEGFTKTVDAFRDSHPDIDVRLVFAANDLATNQKFFTAVAARRPPDVIFVDGPQVAPWAEWGALESLTARCKAAGIAQDDYFAPCWRQNLYRGDVWALTFCADPNFGFVWNKQAFRDAGLDPERPPTTMEELDAYAERLTKEEQGAIVQIGLIPWAQYGGANSMFTWGWAFGGAFYDYERDRITADDPRVIDALRWIGSYAEKYGVGRIGALQQTFGSAEQNPFCAGKVALMCLHISGVQEIDRYAPDLDYGVGFIPAPPDGEQRSSWVGGWCIAIPRGAKNQDAGWEFMRWLCHDPEATRLLGENTGLFPGLKTSPYFDQIRDKPYYGAFLRILEECRHQRPVMPVQAFYMRALERAVDDVIYGKRSPEAALAKARESAQRELDLVLEQPAGPL
jgi:multiple sugar transport system substrate-binding protein